MRDFTTLDCLSRCEQEHAYRYQQHLARAEPDASPHLGSAVHAGVRALFDGKSVLEASAAVVHAWGDFVAPPKKAHLNLTYAQSMVEQYHAQHFGAVQPFTVVLNERYLEWPERELCGIVDRIVRSKADGALYVMDLKTTGLYLAQAWLDQWRHSLQAAIYLDLAEHVLGEPIAGFWLDAVHVNKRGYAKREDFMRVGPFPYSEALRAELRAEVQALQVRAMELAEVPAEARKNPRSCFRYNALCPFFRFCTLEPADREDAIKMALAAGEFVTQVWEPGKRG